MEMVKRNLFVIILLVITAGLTVPLALQVKKAMDAVTDEKDSFVKLNESQKALLNGPYRLGNKNVERAKQNRIKAEAEYLKLIRSLMDKRVKLSDKDKSLNPYDLREILQDRCLRLVFQLKNSRVEYPEALRRFGFDHYFEDSVLPTQGEVSKILRMLEIIDELVYFVFISKVTSLNELKVDPMGAESFLDLNPGTFFDFHKFNISITGRMDSIERFLNSILPPEKEEDRNDKYYFQVRKVTFKVVEPQIITPKSVLIRNKPKKKRNRPHNMSPKDNGSELNMPEQPGERIVFKPPEMVTADIVVEYIEFHDKNE